jgi:hypothetical protein
MEPNVTVVPSRADDLPILFKPEKGRNGQLDITVTIADNPKLCIPIQIHGAGSSKDVVFEGIANELGRQQRTIVVMRNMGAYDAALR